MADAGSSGRNAKDRLVGPRAIVKLLESFGFKHERHAVFRDCMEMMAIALSNAVDKAQFVAREERYLSIVKRYAKEEMEVFTRILAELAMALEAGHDDVMGKVFGALELGNAAAGQFFTPFEVSRLMARMTVGDGGDARRLIEEHGFVSVMEPAVGAGGMVIAMAEAMRDSGINYQEHMHVTAVDVDARAAHMAYVQFSLLHIPAVVIVGNSISLEEREHWRTPAHVLGGWRERLQLRQGRAISEIPVIERADASTAAPVGQAGQLLLF